MVRVMVMVMARDCLQDKSHEHQATPSHSFENVFTTKCQCGKCVYAVKGRHTKPEVNIT